MDKDRFTITKGFTLWFTGLPSSGKTSVAGELARYLEQFYLPVVFLDGDIIRPIIAEGIGCSESDRHKSLLKYIELTNALIKSKVITILAVINHSQEQRNLARRSHPDGRFVEVWINTPLGVCIQRDVKGLYKKAFNGETKNVVGVDIEYCPPKNPNVTINTQYESLPAAAEKIFRYLKEKNLIVPVL